MEKAPLASVIREADKILADQETACRKSYIVSLRMPRAGTSPTTDGQAYSGEWRFGAPIGRPC
jgi:hypothetical protein